MQIDPLLWQQVASDLINSSLGVFGQHNGQAVFTNPGQYDPINDTNTAGETLTVPAIHLEYESSQVDGQNIKAGDRQLVIEEILIGAFLIDPDGTELSFTGIKPNDSAVALKVVNVERLPATSAIFVQVRDK